MVYIIEFLAVSLPPHRESHLHMKFAFFSVEIYIFSFYASLVSSRITSFNDSTTYFRFAPIIGQFKISDIATMSFLLNQVWGRVVKVGGLMGRPDLLFVFDADEIEKVRMEYKCD